MQFYIKQSMGGIDLHTLHVFNCGYNISIHNGRKKYIKSLVRNYIRRMDDPKHAAHGRKAHQFWA